MVKSKVIKTWQQYCTLRNTPHGAYCDVAIATHSIPDLFHAEMAMPGFDPFQTSSTVFKVIVISSAMSTLRMFVIRPFTSPYKAINRDILIKEEKDWNQKCCHSNIKICTMWCIS